ncbi:MAG: FAD-dependent oxidoreductase [Porphyromonadaceae bacterium]|nr:FAD-dependent oxidoreductase [Porphyromonadaceae bacterium]
MHFWRSPFAKGFGCYQCSCLTTWTFSELCLRFHFRAFDIQTFLKCLEFPSLPTAAQNLLVSVCASTSHIAFGFIRMEPVFMILEQSAAVAACMAIDENIAVQDVEYEKLKKVLTDKGQVLKLKGTDGKLRAKSISYLIITRICT